MYLFYRQDLQKKNIKADLPVGVSLIKTSVHPFVKDMNNMQVGKRKCLYYRIFTWLCNPFRRTFLEYNLVKDTKIISKAVLISKVPLYSFLPQNGLHICYCETIPEERGKGLYPLLLNQIQNDYPQRNLYMVVAENNIPSIKGIEKAGFIKYGKGIKNNRGVFIVTNVLV